MTSTQFRILKVVGGLRCIAPAQLRTVLSSIPHTSYHRAMRGLIKNRLLARAYHPNTRFSGYEVTFEGYKRIFASDDIRIPASRPADIFHTALVAEILINLSHYSSLERIIPEHEITKESLKTFCVGRRPDGIILLKNKYGSYEIAVEVERSLKESRRLDSILDCYENTFQRKLACQGVMIVAAANDIFKAYKSLIEKRSKEFQENVLLLELKDTNKLNPDVYGALLPSSQLVRHFGGTKVHDEIITSLESSRSYESKQEL